MCYIDLATGKAPRNKSLHWPLLAEAVSKRKITRAGGKYDLHFDWHVAKVGPAVLGANDSLPMWCAVPVTSKTRLF